MSWLMQDDQDDGLLSSLDKAIPNKQQNKHKHNGEIHSLRIH